MENRIRKKTAQVIVILIVVAILAALLWFVGLPLYREISPNKERVNLREYLGIFGPEDAAVMLGENHSSTGAMVRGGIVYWEVNAVKRNFYDGFWVNLKEGVLLMTTADEVVRAEEGVRSYTRHAEAAPADGVVSEVIKTDMPVFFIENGRGYIALDYAKQFSNFTYEFFKEPYRIQIYAEDDSFEGAEILKNTALRKVQGIKSEVVCELSSGDVVFVLNRMQDWTKVRTKDALIGYVDNKRLSEEGFEVEIKITEDYTSPSYTSLTEDRRLCIAWHQVTVADANAYMTDLVAGAWPLDVISPTWYSIIDESGAVKSIPWKSYVDNAHARGLKVWPLVDDFTDGLDREAFLMSTESRNNFVAYIISQAGEFGFDGINLDFELVPRAAASGFEQLVRELSVACRAHGLVFSIDNYPPRAHSEHYNRGLQGKVADYVIIMGYDEHWGSSSGAGSVSSLPFVRDAIERTLAVVPANKVINAVPFYTRIWSTARDGTVRVEQTIGPDRQDAWIERRELEPIWSEELGQNYTQIDEDSKLFQIWLENAASMQTRINAMKEYGLGGVACWRLGLEGENTGPVIWDILGGYTRG